MREVNQRSLSGLGGLNLTGSESSSGRDQFLQDMHVNLLPFLCCASNLERLLKARGVVLLGTGGVREDMNITGAPARWKCRVTCVSNYDLLCL